MTAESLLREFNDVLISIDSQSLRLYVCAKGRKFAEKNHRRDFYLGLLGFQENELEIEEEVR